MKGIANLIRVHQWKLDEKRREVADLLSIHDDFMAQLAKLEVQMAREREVAGENQDVSFSYANYLQAAKLRQANLNSSLEDLQKQIDVAEDELAEQFQELKKYEISRDMRDKRALDERARKDQIALDDLSIDMYRRKK